MCGTSVAGCRICLAGLSLLFLFAWLGTAGAYLGLVVVVLGFLVSISRVAASLRNDILAWAVMASLSYLLVRSGWAYLEFPDLRDETVDAAIKWGFLGLFVPLAWCLNQYRKYIPLFLGVLFIGFILAVVKLTDWEHCHLFGRISRCGFGFQVILGALLLGSALLGMLLLAPRLVGSVERKWWFAFRFLVWLALLLLCVYFIVVTLTRSVWGALILILPVALYLRYKASWRRAFRERKLLVAGSTIVLVVSVAGAIFSSSHMIESRIKTVFAGDTSHSFLDRERYSTSVRNRISMGEEGIRMWLERPWLGWGSAGVNYPGFLDGIDERSGYLTHFHNIYIELLVRFGIVGATLFLLPVVLLVVRLCNFLGEAGSERDIALFVLSSIALLGIWSFFDFGLNSVDWRFYAVIITGFAYALVMDGKGGSEPREKT